NIIKCRPTRRPALGARRHRSEDVINPLQSPAGLAIAPLLIGPAHAQTVSIITTPAGSYSNSGGAAMAKVVNDKAKIRMIVQAQASSGFDELEAAGAEVNVSNSFDVTFVVAGTGDYQGPGPGPKIRHDA